MIGQSQAETDLASQWMQLQAAYGLHDTAGFAGNNPGQSMQGAFGYTGNPPTRPMQGVSGYPGYPPTRPMQGACGYPGYPPTRPMQGASGYPGYPPTRPMQGAIRYPGSHPGGSMQGAFGNPPPRPLHADFGNPSGGTICPEYPPSGFISGESNYIYAGNSNSHTFHNTTQGIH